MLFSVIITLTLIGITVSLVYTFMIWNFDYWKKRGVKGPKPRAFHGNFPSLISQKRCIAYDMEEIYKQFRNDEDFVGVFSIRTPELMIISPELVHKVLVTDFKNFHDNEFSTWFDDKADNVLGNNPFALTGETWKERRQEITPGLTTNRIKAVYPVTQDVCENLIKYIAENCVNSETGIDAKDLSLRYTSEVVSDCVLGVKAGSFTNNPTPILEMTKSLFVQNTAFIIYGILVGLLPSIKRIYSLKFFKKETEDFFKNLMATAFQMRRKQQNVDRVDFLNYILQLQEKKNLSNNDLVSHSMTFLLDGFETSASVLSLCLYQLAKNPKEQEKLYAEILNNLNAKKRIDFEKLETLSYLDQCIHESMRIIPPQFFAKKLCTEPCELTNKNGNKLQLNRNDIILLPVHSFYNDEEYFPNPKQFIPERFDSEQGGVKKYRDMGVFVPFGDGPRACLGMKFALTQVKAALTEIIKKFNVKLNPRTRTDDLLDRTYFIGSLEGGVWLDFEERNPL